MDSNAEYRYRQWVGYQREIDDICASLTLDDRQRLFRLWRESLRLEQRQLIALPSRLRPLLRSICCGLSFLALLPIAVCAVVALWRMVTHVITGDWDAMADYAVFYFVSLAAPMLVWAWYHMGRDAIVEDENAPLAFSSARRLEAHLGALPQNYWG